MCGNSIKGKLKNGKPACGVHIKAEERREATKKRDKLRREKQRSFTKEIRAFCEKHNIKFRLINGQTRVIEIEFDSLVKAIEEKND